MRRWDRSQYRILFRIGYSCLILLLCLPAFVFAREIYKFERLWPTLQQPWYFHWVAGIALDDDGNFYVASYDYDRVSKYNANGQLVTRWGITGRNKGEFLGVAGIARDRSGNLYVADKYNHRIQKFTSDGRFLASWGKHGSGNGEFNEPRAVASDRFGHVYVADSLNYRVQKFDANGRFLKKWGKKGSGNGRFGAGCPEASNPRGPAGVAVGPDGCVYVCDPCNSRIQQFTANGRFLSAWGRSGSGQGEFDEPRGVVVDATGAIYVTDYGNWTVQKFTATGRFLTRWGWGNKSRFEFPWGIGLDPHGYLYVGDNQGIQKLTVEGRFITKYGSGGSNPGEIDNPYGIAAGPDGSIFVSDTYNHRIQKFTSDGRFISSLGKYGKHPGEFSFPTGLRIGAEGRLYVVDAGNDRIQVFDSEGSYISSWGESGSGPGQFNLPSDLTVDAAGNTYVVDTYNYRVQKFGSNGSFITEWGGYGTGDGNFLLPWGISLDSRGNVFVTDHDSDGKHSSIKKFSSDGKFILKWGRDESIVSPRGIFIDEADSIFVIDWTPSFNIKKFSPNGRLVAKWGAYGDMYGSLGFPSGLTVSSTNQRVYVADCINNRIQSFRAVTRESNSRAIIVAGGGPYAGNVLWPATEMCANFAYRTLAYQGFAKESIHYLSSDTQLDLDGNGAFDDVDGEATNTNLKTAITEWANGAGDVILYLVDHGGNGTFRMNGQETLATHDLSSWLDQLQQTINGKLIIIYDACQSGSFLDALSSPAGQGRIVITSTSPGEDAYFVNQGSISFSDYFWTHVFNGLDTLSAFDLARQAIDYTTDSQHPLLDDNGNGEGNDPEDGKLARATFLGSGTDSFNSAPTVKSVSSDQTISGTSKALLFAEEVSDPDGIARVWAVIRPPSCGAMQSGNPVRELPTMDLVPKGKARYEGVYAGFNASGTYQVAIYAMDRVGNTSIPKLTTVSVDSPLRRKAILVAGGSQSDPLWPVVEKSVGTAYDALRFQGYADEDLSFMSPVSIAGVDQLPTLENLRFAIESWARESTQDLVLYLVGTGGDGTFRINSSETLRATDLKTWLDNLQTELPGKVTVIYDASHSGSFLPQLVPPTGRERILVTSAGSDQTACFVSGGDLSFSTFLWSQVANGATVRESFLQAAVSIGSICPEQVASLDDNGNGKGNENSDGELARFYTIGAGILLAGDAPVIGTIMPAAVLDPDRTAVAIWVQDVTTTGALARVWAVITPPNYQSQGSAGAVTDLPTVELTDAGGGRFEAIYDQSSTPGRYNVSVFAQDTRGNLSLPVQTTVTR